MNPQRILTAGGRGAGQIDFARGPGDRAAFLAIDIDDRIGADPLQGEQHGSARPGLRQFDLAHIPGAPGAFAVTESPPSRALGRTGRQAGQPFVRLPRTRHVHVSQSAGGRGFRRVQHRHKLPDAVEADLATFAAGGLDRLLAPGEVLRNGQHGILRRHMDYRALRQNANILYLHGARGLPQAGQDFYRRHVGLVLVAIREHVLLLG